jgi:hypothetical protein
MKKTTWFLALIGLIFSSCTTQKQATTYATDDVYGTPVPAVSAQVSGTQPTEKGTQVITSPDKTSVSKPGSSTFEDDYNDYSYSNRIQKFNSSDTTKGYFDDSNSSSAQSGGSGSEPNVNVYLGFGAGYGGYYGSSFGFSYGYPYSSWGWDYGWGYPYYGWGYPYYGWGYPYYGYNPWYNPCCYCYGYYDGYYNEYPPYAASGTYYGPRETLYRSDNGNSTLNTRNAQPMNNNSLAPNDRSQSTAPLYTRSDKSTNSNVGSVQPSQRSTPVSQEKYRYTRTESQRQAPNQRTTQKTQVQNNAVRSQPSPKYIRPENAEAIQRSGSTQSYSSPVYRQPKTSQEYLAPRLQTQGSSRSGSSESKTSVRSTTSGAANQLFSSPSTEAIRSGNSTGKARSSGYSEPARSNNNVSSPSRTGNSGTYSAPARSSGSGNYSAPTRSGGTTAPSGGGSYSAPTRSSGGSGSGSGGSAPASGGSSGRRR